VLLALEKYDPASHLPFWCVAVQFASEEIELWRRSAARQGATVSP
jgi:hypothetical protein